MYSARLLVIRSFDFILFLLNLFLFFQRVLLRDSRAAMDFLSKNNDFHDVTYNKVQDEAYVATKQ